MAGSQSSGNAPIHAINVTPLVDVMLVLLVIFMVTAKLADDRDLPFDLPEAASGEVTQTTLNVTLDEHGARSVDGVPVQGDAALSAAARRAQAAHRDLRTVIVAAKRASHGDVMRVLDVLRLAGVTKVAFAIEANKEPAP
jgi:biopolymer transport protein ExbD